MFNKIIKQVILLLAISIPLSSMANDLNPSYSFEFEDTSVIEEFFLTNQFSETRYKDEEVDDTCIRQVPYTENECGNETRYRQECETIPGYEDCRNIEDQECDAVTRYREECHRTDDRQECSRGPDREECHRTEDREECTRGRNREECHRTDDRQECSRDPSRQECSRGPSREECSRGPSRRECTKEPSREECRNKPSRRECTRGPSRQECENRLSKEVCRDLPAETVCEQRNGRKVCRRVPGKRECRTVPGRRVCRDVPGEETCRTVPGKRVCRTIPGRENCRNIPGEETCRTVPGRETCRTVPGEERCRTIPGRRVCTTIPGEETCRTIRGRRICSTVPGEETCRTIRGRRICEQVPYQDQECRSITRRECEWIPEDQNCTDIPYDEWVCNDVTRYREESYACTRTIQVPYVFIRDLKAAINLEFISELENPKALFKFSLSGSGEIVIIADDKCEKESIILATNQIDPIVDIDDLFDVKAFFKLNFIDKNNTIQVLEKDITDFSLTKDKLKFTLGKVDNPNTLNIKIKVMKEQDEMLFDRILKKEEYTLTQVEEGSNFDMSLTTLELGNFIGNYKVKITLELDLPGKVVNKTPINLTRTQKFSKTFEETVVINEGLEKVLSIKNPLKAFPKMLVKYLLGRKKGVKKYVKKIMLKALTDFDPMPKIDRSKIKIMIKKTSVVLTLDFKEEINNQLLLDVLKQKEIEAEFL